MEKNIDYLRFSLTDRCNLNCVYCTPVEKDKFLPREKVLSYEEIAETVALFVTCGIRKVRLTGGEPLVKKDIACFIRLLKGVKGLEEVTMTTNGVHLKNLAPRLKEAGLERINISIDTLKKERFRAITGFDLFDDVWSGIEESLKVGLSPVKLNVILMKGINDDEILDFAKLSIERELVVRFIEFFPTNKRSAKFAGLLVKSGDVKNEIRAKFGDSINIPPVKGNGPAKYYKIKDSRGLIGFINSSTDNFCDDCTRIRIDCAGRISPCLFSGPTHDIGGMIKSGTSREAVLRRIQEVFRVKTGYRKDVKKNHQLEMSSIGG